MIKTFLIAGTATCAAAPLVRRLMVHAGRMDVPNHRSSHVTPTPRGGGLAALAGVAAAAISDRPSVNFGARIAIATLAGVGYADDHMTASGGLSPKLRLIAQGVAGVAASGHSGVIVRVASSLVTLSVVNVVNFMDGINGITGLTALVWGLNAACSDLADVSWIGAATAGGGLGFLPWNTPSARLFLGDTGSYLFGSLMAAGIIRTVVDGHSCRASIVVAAPLFPYMADAAQAIIGRGRRGASLTEAHREHVYQKLVDHAGLSHLQAALIHAFISSFIAVTWRAVRFPTAASTITAAAIASYLYLPTFLSSAEI